MSLLYWFSGKNDLSALPYDARWAWATLFLSTMLVAGYGVIAVNWYFLAKLSRQSESQATLRRLRNLALMCAACGTAIYLAGTPWIVWRVYDLILLVLTIRTWSFICRMRGLSLMDERLAQLNTLEESAARYREIAELLPHMVWTATSNGFVDFSNQRWREFAGDDRTWLRALHPDDNDAALLQWHEALATRQPLTLEARLGGPILYRTFVISATPIVHGDAVKWLGACADIEDQKLLAAEKEMQARQKSFFLNALSHDLRAPLNNIVLNAHLLKLSVQAESDVESLDMIVENSKAAGDLVTKLLDFAKVGAQDQNLTESVSLAATLQQIERRFSPIAEQKGLSLKLAGYTDAKLMTDRQKLDRIISNLVDNAIKYTTRGDVTIELVEMESELCVRISDTGIGIPETSAPYLFDEFYQVNNYERDRSKGFGMGLAICKSLGRHIGADVRLARNGPMEAASKSSSKGSVLIVEDDLGARRAIKRLLLKQGFAVSEAGSVAEAIDALVEPPDWILLDLMLPDGSGTSVLHKIRAEQLSCRVCVITGCDVEALLGGNPTGIEHAFTKPIDVMRLMQILRS